MSRKDLKDQWLPEKGQCREYLPFSNCICFIERVQCSHFPKNCVKARSHKKRCRFLISKLRRLIHTRQDEVLRRTDLNDPVDHLRPLLEDEIAILRRGAVILGVIMKKHLPPLSVSQRLVALFMFLVFKPQKLNKTD